MASVRDFGLARGKSKKLVSAQRYTARPIKASYSGPAFIGRQRFEDHQCRLFFDCWRLKAPEVIDASVN